jgi:glycosyltransferase involved in cell wall biosynthesis
VKVLHLGAGNLYGGVETFFVTLARLRHLAPDMHPEYGLCFRGRVWDELTAAGVPVHDLGAVRVSRPWTVLRARKALAGVLKERTPDVVVTHSGWNHLIFGPVVTAAGVRLVYHAHNPIDRPSLQDRWAARTRPDVVIANTRFTAASVDTLFRGVPTRVVYYPVRVEFPTDRAATRSAVRAEFGTPDAAVVILTSCRMEGWKGHTLLLDALGRMTDVPGWVSWVAGGAQRPAEVEYLLGLKQQAERLGIADRVKFLGQRSDVPRLLVSADVHCQPNTGPEPFGIAFVEALAAGLPVVTTAMGGALEVVDDTCGVLVPPGDAAGLATALGQLVRQPEQRSRFGCGGATRAAELCDPAHALLRLAESFRLGHE